MNSTHNNSNPSIPFLDLVTPHVELEKELTEVFLKAIRTAGFIGGPMVEEFEKAFASFCQTSHAVAIDIVAIEEHWELNVGEPDAASSAPQVCMVTSPTGNLDGQLNRGRSGVGNGGGRHDAVHDKFQL